MDLWILWLIIIILLTFLEVITIGLVSIWFVISALISLILSFFISSFYIQFAVFVLLGIIFMVTTRPILEKLLVSNKENTNLDRVVGMKAKATQDILKNEIGEVKVDGKIWSAISKEEILKGETVKIKKIEGVKLVVEKEGN